MTQVAKTHESCNNADVETVARQQAFPAKGETVQLIETTTELQHPLDSVEAAMLDMPQIDCPLTHHFGGGIYIREGFIAAGTYIIGHTHKKHTMNVLLKGKMAVFVNGEVKVIEGPFIFVSEPGRKLGYAIEDCVFQNIHPTESTDIDEIEAEFIEKSEARAAKHIENENALAIDMAVSKYLRSAS